MEKAFAYICASEEAAPRLLKRYCRKVYELGYVPICPKLSEAQYLPPDNADEKRDFHSIARQKLGRCRMLVVCGNEISHSMSAEIGAAEKRNLICTTLDGLAKIKEADENGGLYISGVFSLPAGDWICKHSVWISKRILGSAPTPRRTAPADFVQEMRGENTERKAIRRVRGKRQNTGQPAPERGKLRPRRF